MKSAFESYPSFTTLNALAKNPYDLTKEGNLMAERIHRMRAEACGLAFLYGTERVTDEVMQALEALAEDAKAIEKMEKMQRGEVLNVIEGYPSDNRAVLHTAMRDFFENKQTAPQAKEAANLALQEHEKLKKFLAQVEKEGRFTDLIAVAIGGSDLGPRCLYLSLQLLQKKGRNVHFISNLDPDDVATVVSKVDLKQCLVVVVSKSGGTLETLTNEELLRHRFLSAGLKPEEHFLAVTAKGSPMDDKKKYLECFHMWDYVGGRFSAASMVGAVTLSFAFGHDVFWELLKGAHAMDQVALKPNLQENLPLLGALIAVWNHNFLHYPTVAVVPYSQALWRLPAHIQQVEMESNGKCIDRVGRAVNFQTGPIIWGEPGTNAQHSFYQLIHQGTAIVPLELIGFRDSQRGQDLEVNGTSSQEKLLANLFAQAIALATGKQDDNPNKTFPGNRPSHILLGKQLTPYAMGTLFVYYEHKVAFQGFLWNINSFDQEGVQLGKVLANKILEQFAAKREGSTSSFPLGQAFLEQVGRMK